MIKSILLAPEQWKIGKILYFGLLGGGDNLQNSILVNSQERIISKILYLCHLKREKTILMESLERTIGKIQYLWTLKRGQLIKTHIGGISGEDNWQNRIFVEDN